MSFGNVSLAVEDHGTTALKAEVTKLHKQVQTCEIVSLYFVSCGADNTAKGGTAAWFTGLGLTAFDAGVKIGATNGHMVEREKIQHGTRLRLLSRKDDVASGTLARVDTRTVRKLRDSVGL
jgi:hypothetical protein